MPAPQHHLEIRHSTDDAGRVVLDLAGDLDLQTAPELRDRVKAAGEAGATTVVLDLRHVEHMDSPGVGMLIYCNRLLERSGSHLVARSPRTAVRELFELVQLDSIITLE